MLLESPLLGVGLGVIVIVGCLACWILISWQTLGANRFKRTLERATRLLMGGVPTPTQIWGCSNGLAGGIAFALLVLAFGQLFATASESFNSNPRLFPLVILIGFGAVVGGSRVVWATSRITDVYWDGKVGSGLTMPDPKAPRKGLRVLCWTAAVLLATCMWAMVCAVEPAKLTLGGLLRLRDRVQIELLLIAVVLASGVVLVGADFYIEGEQYPSVRDDRRRDIRALGALWTLLLIAVYAPVHFILAHEAQRMVDSIELLPLTAQVQTERLEDLKKQLETRKALDDTLNVGFAGFRGLDLVSIATPFLS